MGVYRWNKSGWRFEGKGTIREADAHIAILILVPIARVALFIEKDFRFLVVPQDNRALQACRFHYIKHPIAIGVDSFAYVAATADQAASVFHLKPAVAAGVAVAAGLIRKELVCGGLRFHQIR